MVEDVFPPIGWSLAAPKWGNKRDRRRDAKEGQVFGVLVWNYETHEGEVLLHPSFRRVDGIGQADILSDVIGLLEREREGPEVKDGVA